MERVLHWFSGLDWVAISGVLVASISFWVAKKTLNDAEEYWKQQKWFDLYARADQAYNDLDRYRVTYKTVAGIMTEQQEADWNTLMISIRGVHTMAMVFQVCEVINKLVEATAHFEHPSHAFFVTRMPTFLDALEGLRQMARLNPNVLKLRKLPE